MRSVRWRNGEALARHLPEVPCDLHFERSCRLPFMSDWAATRRLPVEILLAEGVTLRGDLHLQPGVANHEGTETPLELLNRPEPFFVLSVADGITFVSREQVAAVRCAPPVVPDDPDRLNAATRLGLEVVLWGGATYRGWAIHELPPHRARTLDYLNTSGRFFAVSNDTETRYLNRSHVAVVRPFD